MSANGSHGWLYIAAAGIAAWIAKIGLSELFVRRSVARREVDEANRLANDKLLADMKADLEGALTLIEKLSRRVAELEQSRRQFWRDGPAGQDWR